MDLLNRLFRPKTEPQPIKRRETNNEREPILTEEEMAGIEWRTELPETSLDKWTKAAQKIGAGLEVKARAGEKFQRDIGPKTVQNGQLYIEIKLPQGTAYDQKERFWKAIDQV